MKRLLLALTLIAALTACADNSEAALDDAIAVADVLNSYGADFTSVTPDRPGVVAIETTLYPKAENKEHAALVCAPVVAEALAGNLPGIRDVRVRASDKTTLHVCPIP